MATQVETDILGVFVEIITVERVTNISLEYIWNFEHTEKFIDNCYHGDCSHGADNSGDRIMSVFVSEH